MNIKWYGHSCFRLTDSNGVAILTDPCDKNVGYNIYDVECDAVTVSHNHFDHNFVGAAKGSPDIIDSLGAFDVKGVRVIGFASMHDKVGGAERGSNTMYLFEIDNMRVLHAGDIGQLPDEAKVAEIGQVDVLLVPIGGKYTLDYLEARELANILKPSIVIPMHYRAAGSKFEIDDVNNFISTAKDCRIHRLNDCEASISRNSLGEDRVLVLDPYVEKND